MGGRIGLASVVLALLGVGLAHAEPLRIRAAWVAPVSDWMSIWLDKKDLAVHYGKSYVMEFGSLQWHAADDHRDGQR